MVLLIGRSIVPAAFVYPSSRRAQDSRDRPIHA
jgi:hypothetical protein